MSEAIRQHSRDAAAGGRRNVVPSVRTFRVPGVSLSFLAAVLLAGKLVVAAHAAGAAPTSRPTGETKPTLAVVPFDLRGPMAVQGPGRTIAVRLMAAMVGSYDVIDLPHLPKYLAQARHEASDLVDAPDRGRKASRLRIRSVRYLVLGEIVSDVTGLNVTAWLADWRTGQVLRTAQTRASDWPGLLERVPVLAGMLGAKLPAPLRTLAAPRPGQGVADASLSTLLERLAHEQARLRLFERKLQPDHPERQAYREILHARARSLGRDIRAALAALATWDERLSRDYRADHPRRAGLRKRIAELRKARDGLLADVLGVRERQGPLDAAGARQQQQAFADLLGHDAVVAHRISDTVSLRLALVPPGQLAVRRGDAPAVTLRLPGPLLVSTTEITQAQYRAVLGESPWKNKAYTKESDDAPAVYVSRADAQRFCRALSRLWGRIVRLPTKAEWEYAARAGTDDATLPGPELRKTAWIRENAWAANAKYAHPAGRLAANAWGLYDVLGNVWEWVAPDADDTPGQMGLLCGGSWDDPATTVNFAARWRRSPASPFSRAGFRVVMEVPR